MVRHRIRFKYGGAEDDTAVDMAFSKKKIEERKVSYETSMPSYYVNCMLQMRTRKSLITSKSYQFIQAHLYSNTRHCQQETGPQFPINSFGRCFSDAFAYKFLRIG